MAGRKKKRTFPKNFSEASESGSSKSDEVVNNKADNDDALATIFTAIVLFLGSGSNLWWKVEEIADGLRKVGVRKINEFEVRLALNKFTRRQIVATHMIKLPGKGEERDMYYQLASVIDGETPLTQRVSETSGRRVRVDKSVDSNILNNIAPESLENIDAFCQLEEEDDDDEEENNALCSCDKENIIDANSNAPEIDSAMKEDESQDNDNTDLTDGNDDIQQSDTGGSVAFGTEHNCGVGTAAFDVDRIRGGGSEGRIALADLSDQLGYRITDMDLEFQTMQILFHHGFECAGQGPRLLQVISRAKHGWAMKDRYKCGCCGKEFEFVTSSFTRTNAVATGTKYSKKQPTINILVSKSAKLFGIGYEKLRKLAAGVRIQCPTRTNVLSLGRKVQNAMKEVGKQCLLDN